LNLIHPFINVCWAFGCRYINYEKAQRNSVGALTIRFVFEISIGRHFRRVNVLEITETHPKFNPPKIAGWIFQIKSTKEYVPTTNSKSIVFFSAQNEIFSIDMDLYVGIRAEKLKCQKVFLHV
jgi:hypothetical protein